MSDDSNAGTTGRTAQIHVLKTWPEFFDAVERGGKTFEVRRNDRDFHVDDVLVLQRWEPDARVYSADDTGHPRMVSRRVSYVLPGGQFGIADGFVVMGLREVT